MLLNDALDLLLGLRRNSALGDLGKQSLLRAGEVLAELALPADDLVNGDGIELRGMINACYSLFSRLCSPNR